MLVRCVERDVLCERGAMIVRRGIRKVWCEGALLVVATRGASLSSHL